MEKVKLDNTSSTLSNNIRKAVVISTFFTLVPLESTLSAACIYKKVIQSKMKSTRSNNNKRYSLESLQRNKKILNNFLKLGDNWNYNGAKAFSEEIITKANEIIDAMEYQPKIFPTSRQSVQLEFENEKGDYLEFEIFRDKIIYYLSYNGEDKEDIITDIDLNKLVNKIYA